jgi:hypothetical protein
MMAINHQSSTPQGGTGMRAVRHRATDRTAMGAVEDAFSQELKGRLRSLHDRCLTGLVGAFTV